MRIKKIWIPLVIAILMIIAPVSARADTEGKGGNILFIIDASGSMKKKIEGQRKLDVAKDVLSALVSDLPSETNAGLMVYGYSTLAGKEGCAAIELAVPIGKVDEQRIQKKIDRLIAKGKTPIADSLKMGAREFKKAPGHKTIILISDGEENCGGSPVAVASRIREKWGVEVVIDVVGFDVKGQGKRQLMDIALAGGGTYYSADNAQQLKESFNQIKKEIVKIAPPAPEPKAEPEPEPVKEEPPKDIFIEEFDKPFLSENWEVINEDPDNMVIEDGYLTILLQPGWPSEGTAKNILLYSGDLPKNYEVAAKFKAHIEDFPSLGSSSSQRVGLVLYTSKDNFIEMTTAAEGFAGYKSNEIKVASGKYKEGKWSSGNSSIITTIGSDQWTYKGEFEFKFQKNGHKYIGFFKNAKGKWVKCGEFADLKGKYKPGIMAYHAPKTNETMAEFDSFKIKGVE